jgi:WD40 repeat protein
VPSLPVDVTPTGRPERLSKTRRGNGSHKYNPQQVFGRPVPSPGPAWVLATADSDGNTYLRDWASGKMTGTLTDPDTEGVEAVAVSPGGTVLAACDASGSAYLWHF